VKAQDSTVFSCDNDANSKPCNKCFGLDSLAKLFKTSGIDQGRIFGKSAKDTSMLVTQTTFNDFAAKKVANYLSGSEDLSLYENFSIADVAEGKLTVGHNFSNKDFKKKADYGRVKFLVTAGIQTNIANDVATVFSKKEFTDETGANLKFTWLIATGTRIKFNQTQKTDFNKERYNYYCRLYSAVTKARNECMQIPCDTAPQRQYVEEATEKNLEDFYKFELVKMQKMRPKHGYNRFFTHWWSIRTYIPFTEKKYSIAIDTNYIFNNHQYYNWSASINYGGVWERFFGTFFYNVMYKAYLNNTIEVQDTTLIVPYNQSTITPVKNGASYLTDDPAVVYVGKYANFYSHSLQAQIVWLWSIKETNKIGLSFTVEQDFGSYNATNIKAGMPLFLKGKEEDKGVNVEFQLKLADVGSTLPTKLSSEDKLSFGLSVAIPFGSALN